MASERGHGSTRARLIGVDVLRALAIFWVIAFHLSVNVGRLESVEGRYTRLTSAIGDGAAWEMLRALGSLVLRLGYQGVPLFMMLSGFVLAHNTLRRERAEPLLSYYANRARALLTPYWIAFALVVAAIVALAYARHLVDGGSFLAELRRNTRSGGAAYPVDGELLLAGLTIIPRGFSEDWLLAPAPSLWFVLLFVQFYIVFPALMAIMRRIGPWPFMIGGLVLTLAAKVPLTLRHDGYGLLFDWWVDSSYLPFNLFPFVLGMSLAAMYARDRRVFEQLAPGWIGGGLVAYVGLLLHTGGSLVQGRSGLISVISAPMIVLGLTAVAVPLLAYLERPAARPQRLWGALAWAGALSYALLIASDPFQFAVGTMRTLDTPTWVWAAFWVAYVPALVGLAWTVNRAATAINRAEWRRGRRWAVSFGAAAAITAAGVVAVAAMLSREVDGDADIPFHIERPVAAFLSDQVCPLVGAGGGGAGIRGQDGGTTNVIGGRSYWTFGDTVLTNGGLLPNGVAYSDDTEPDDCIDLHHKTDEAGVAAALLPAAPGEQTVWAATGQVSLDGRTVYFPFESVAGSDYKTGSYPFKGVGLAKFDAETLVASRVIDRLFGPEDFPGESLSLTPATQIMLHDGYVYLYIAVNWNVRVARVVPAEIENPAAYRYWDGAGWAGEPRAAIDILQTAGGQQAFNTAYSDALGRWVATYSTNTLTSIAMAFADRPEGPYTDEVVLFECRDLFPKGQVPQQLMVFPELADQYYCYHGTRHPQYDVDGGSTVYLTYGNIASYRLYLHRVGLGMPVEQWDAGGGSSVLVAGGAAPADGLTKRGVAFYAPRVAAPGLVAVRNWHDARTGEHRYETAAPGSEWEDRGIAFYASEAPREGLAAVFRWDGGARYVYSTFDLTEKGYRKSGVAFYAAGLDWQTPYNARDGYVYWVHAKGDSDFGCCGSLNNPTRQTQDERVRFTLANPPNPAGYEAVVCTPVCGTGGTVVWKGDVSFSPNAVGGTLVLTPKGPR